LEAAPAAKENKAEKVLLNRQRTTKSGQREKKNQLAALQKRL
jgi:hypothetical protein